MQQNKSQTDELKPLVKSPSTKNKKLWTDAHVATADAVIVATGAAARKLPAH